MWPRYILDQFACIPHDTPIVNNYYGVYNGILNTVFFIEDDFSVELQDALPEAVGVSSINPVMAYVVKLNNRPIFFLEIQPPRHLNRIYSRVSADAQIRARFQSLYNIAPAPGIHGISVMGQRLAFSYMDKATGHINPDVAPSASYAIDTVPADRWETDIMTEEGYARFMTVINTVKEIVAAP